LIVAPGRNDIIDQDIRYVFRYPLDREGRLGLLVTFDRRGVTLRRAGRANQWLFTLKATTFCNIASQ